MLLASSSCKCLALTGAGCQQFSHSVARAFQAAWAVRSCGYRRVRADRFDCQRGIHGVSEEILRFIGVSLSPRRLHSVRPFRYFISA